MDADPLKQNPVTIKNKYRRGHITNPILVSGQAQVFKENYVAVERITKKGVKYIDYVKQYVPVKYQPAPKKDA